MNPRLRPPGVSLDTDWPDIAHLAKYRVSGLVRLYGQKRAWIWRLWLRECQRPPKMWLEVMRWTAAARLAPHMTTEAIARHLFYTDASHLTHDFRRHFHTTIHEYRAEARWQAHVATRAHPAPPLPSARRLAEAGNCRELSIGQARVFQR